MKTVINEVEETTPETNNEITSIDWNNLGDSQTDKTADRLDDYLSDYKESEIEIPEETTTVNNQQQNSNENFIVDGLDKRYYYVSGKKKGQKRPKPLIRYEQQAKPVELSGAFLTGALMLTLVDMLIPMLIASLNNSFSKQKINPDLLRMTADQKKELEPVADAFLKSVKIEANPALVLGIGMLGIYGMNFLLIKQSLKNER